MPFLYVFKHRSKIRKKKKESNNPVPFSPSTFSHPSPPLPRNTPPPPPPPQKKSWPSINPSWPDVWLVLLTQVTISRCNTFHCCIQLQGDRMTEHVRLNLILVLYLGLFQAVVFQPPELFRMWDVGVYQETRMMLIHKFQAFHNVSPCFFCFPWNGTKQKSAGQELPIHWPFPWARDQEIARLGRFMKPHNVETIWSTVKFDMQTTPFSEKKTQICDAFFSIREYIWNTNDSLVNY